MTTSFSFFKKVASTVTTLAIIGGISLPLFSAHAAQLINASHTLSTLKAGEVAIHEIKFITSQQGMFGGFALQSSSGFTGFSNLTLSDILVFEGNTDNCETSVFSPITVYEVMPYSDHAEVSTDSVAANKCLKIVIGLGSNKLTNPVTANSNPGYVMFIADGLGNSANIAIPILDDNASTRRRRTVSGSRSQSFSKNNQVESAQQVPAESVGKGEPTPFSQKGECSADQIITENLKAPSRNGVYNSYTGKKVSEITRLQSHLNRLGFNAGPVDGIVGPLSTAAIKRMQVFLGTPADGFVGPITKALINNSCGEKKV